MGVFNVVKVLGPKSFYAKAGDTKCPDCGGQIYLEMPRETYDELAARLMTAGEMIDWERIDANSFCWNCEYKMLKDLKKTVSEIEDLKLTGADKMERGYNLHNQGEVMDGLNTLVKAFARFMNLFEFNISMPDSDEEDKEDKEDKEDSNIIITS